MPGSSHTRNSQVSLGCSSLYLLAAYACIITATATCNFIKATGINDAGGTESVERGIWKGTEAPGDGCSSWGGGFDSKHRASMAMSIIACVIGGFAALPLVCACGKKLYVSQIASVSGGCMKAALFSGLTLLMKKSAAICTDVEGLTNVSCKIDTGGRLAIAATVLFFMAGLSMSCIVTVTEVVQEQEAQQQQQKAQQQADEEEAGEQ